MVSFSQEVKRRDLMCAGVMWGPCEGLLWTHIAVCGSLNNVENKSFLFFLSLLPLSPIRTDSAYLLTRCSFWNPARSSSQPSCVWARKTTLAPSSWNTSNPSRHVDHRPLLPCPPFPVTRHVNTRFFTVSCCAATRPRRQRPARKTFSICCQVFVYPSVRVFRGFSLLLGNLHSMMEHFACKKNNVVLTLSFFFKWFFHRKVYTSGLSQPLQFGEWGKVKYSMCQHLSDTRLSNLGVAKSCSKAKRTWKIQLVVETWLANQIFIFLFCPVFRLNQLLVWLFVGSSAQRLLIINPTHKVEVSNIKQK